MTITERVVKKGVKKKVLSALSITTGEYTTACSWQVKIISAGYCSWQLLRQRLAAVSRQQVVKRVRLLIRRRFENSWKGHFATVSRVQNGVLEWDSRQNLAR